eukprot:4038861-Prymnesium_polylepis.1
MSPVRLQLGTELQFPWPPLTAHLSQVRVISPDVKGPGGPCGQASHFFGRKQVASAARSQGAREALTRKIQRPQGKRDSGDCMNDTAGTSRLHARNSRTSDAFRVPTGRS